MVDVLGVEGGENIVYSAQLEVHLLDRVLVEVSPVRH